ncbi:MAG: DUF6663 family protein [Halobacteriota archaeon]
MELRTSGRFRVFDSPREASELLLIDVEGGEYDPAYVRTDGHENALREEVTALRPGYLVDATLEWTDGTPRVAGVDIVRPTLFEFVDGVTGLFEAARETWKSAVETGAAMNARVTYDTDGQANGVLYVFAKQPGATDLYEEFHRGVRPLEPLVERTNEADDGPREVFVMRPVDEEFILVCIALQKGGLFADTIRDTYDCPRPD